MRNVRVWFDVVDIFTLWVDASIFTHSHIFPSSARQQITEMANDFLFFFLLANWQRCLAPLIHNQFSVYTLRFDRLSDCVHCFCSENIDWPKDTRKTTSMIAECKTANRIFRCHCNLLHIYDLDPKVHRLNRSNAINKMHLDNRQVSFSTSHRFCHDRK